jgi:hypothetical protein
MNKRFRTTQGGPESHIQLGCRQQNSEKEVI